MRKFISKLFFAAIPFILYIVIFVVYEPYNYWGLKPKNSGNWASPLARTREYMRNPSDKIIIGDSRMNHFDLDLIEELTGERWANLSTGGQGINLTYLMFKWANEKNEVSKCLIDASFYQLKLGSRSVAPDAVFFITEHPLEYLSTYDYVKEAWDEMGYAWGMKERPGRPYQRDEDIDAIIEADNKYRDDLLEYALYNIYPNVSAYSIDEESMTWISDISKQIDDNDGDMMILLPCVQESIWEYVIEPLEMQPYLEQYREELLELPVTIYDMEWKSMLSQNQDIYADGFHFIGVDEYQKYYTMNIFGTPDANVRILNYGIIKDEE